MGRIRLEVSSGRFAPPLTPVGSKVLRIDERRSRSNNGSSRMFFQLALAPESKPRAMGVMTPFAASASPVPNRLLTGGGGERSGRCRPHWLRLMSGSMHRHQGSSHFISQPAHLITPLIQPRRTITSTRTLIVGARGKVLNLRGVVSSGSLIRGTLRSRFALLTLTSSFSSHFSSHFPL